jgi:hypothetical protein
MTSLLRELVPVPMESAASSTMVSRPLEGQTSRYGKADNTSADDNAIDVIRHG